MDITFETEAGRFNYRVCAVLLDRGRILAMHDERSPYFYLPGGRVRMGERAEDAVLREVREELGIEARILRPLWLSQSFFNEDVVRVDYHELCLYFLLDAAGTDLLSRGGCASISCWMRRARICCPGATGSGARSFATSTTSSGCPFPGCRRNTSTPSF